jgi:hypothetical protein
MGKKFYAFNANFNKKVKFSKLNEKKIINNSEFNFLAK